MIEKLTKISLSYRFFLTIVFFCTIAYGGYLYCTMPIDAFPDISPIMVPIFTEADGMAPEEVERLITWPIESSMNGLPDIEKVKSTSAFGMSVVYVYFKDKVDIYFARQLVSQQLGSVMSKLSFLHEPPILGPISTGLGQILIYYLTIDTHVDTNGLTPLMYLRDLNDWVIKYQLQTISGVTDVLSMGGKIPQFQIILNPLKMKRYNVTLDEVIESVQNNNKNTGGQYLISGSEEYLIRGLSFVKSLDDLKNIQLKLAGETPVTLNNIAEIKWGSELRRGVVTRNGEEVVSGIVIKLFGENTSKTINLVHDKIKEIQETLPNGVKIVPYYEQSDLVNSAANTIKTALIEGMILVVMILLLCLWNFRAALIVSVSIPFCAAIAIIGMHFLNISANLMSLGGIAIALGTLVDGAVVTVENIIRKNHTDDSSSSFTKRIIESTMETGKPIVFSIIIIIAVFIPIFALEGVENKMFTPMAFTIMSALVGSLIFSIIFAPALCSFIFSSKKNKKNAGHYFWHLAQNRLYRPILIAALKLKYILIVCAIAAFIISIIGLSDIGKEFIPVLEENSILMTLTMPPSISLDKAIETVKKFEKKIIEHNEVKDVVSRIGRPEAGSHPHPINYAEVQINLKDKSNVHSKKRLVVILRKQFEDYPGVHVNFSQPIQNAFDELISGIKAQVAVKVYGENLEKLQLLSKKIENSLHTIKGLVDISADRSLGQPQVQIIVNREALKRFGVPASLVTDTVEKAIGGEVVDFAYLNVRRYGINVRLHENFRSDIDKIKQLLIPVSEKKTVKLGQLADFVVAEGPVQINRQNNHRVWTVQCNIKNRALGDVIKEIKSTVSKIKLPPGYFVEYGGQFENQQRAMSKLLFIIPFIIAIIFILLFSAFKSLILTLLVMINIPLALMGGVLGLYITGEYLSVPAAIGFIALFGIAMQNAVVMISYFNDSTKNDVDVVTSVIDGSTTRLRPVLMTTLTTLLGLLPLMIATGTGSEIQKPLAAVVIYGLISSTLLTLIFIPILYTTTRRFMK
jgi:heavy metal efflux system protein